MPAPTCLLIHFSTHILMSPCIFHVVPILVNVLLKWALPLYMPSGGSDAYCPLIMSFFHSFKIIGACPILIVSCHITNWHSGQSWLQAKVQTEPTLLFHTCLHKSSDRDASPVSAEYLSWEVIWKRLEWNWPLQNDKNKVNRESERMNQSQESYREGTLRAEEEESDCLEFECFFPSIQCQLLQRSDCTHCLLASHI